MATEYEQELERARKARTNAVNAGDTDSITLIDSYISRIETDLAEAQGVDPTAASGIPQVEEDPNLFPGLAGPQLDRGARETKIAALGEQRLGLGPTTKEGEGRALGGWLQDNTPEIYESSRRAGQLQEEASMGGALNPLTPREMQAQSEVQSYERDLKLPDASPQEVSKWRSQWSQDPSNDDFRLLPGERLVVDPETGQTRKAVASPETLAERRITERKQRDSGLQVKTGSISMIANRLQSEDAEIESRKLTQTTIFNQLSEDEQTRIRGKFPDKDIPDVAPRDFMDAVEENEENEQVLADMSGDEKWESIKERWRRIGNATIGRNLYGGGKPNLFGAEDPEGDIWGIESKLGVEYEEGEKAPLYPGASEHMSEYMNDVDSLHIYENMIQPFFKEGEMLPGDRMAAYVDRIRKEQYSPEALEKKEKRFVAEDADWYNPFSWGDGNTALPWEDFDAFMIHVFENVPQIAAGILSARTGGRGMGSFAGWLHKGQKLSRIETMRRRAAGIGGAASGGASEGLLIHDAVKSDITKQLGELPNEAFENYPYYLSLIEADMPDETARQVVTNEVSRLGGKTAFVASGMLMGAPMGYLFGQRAAGRIGTALQEKGALAGAGRIAAAGGGEMLQEGSQEVSEDVIANVHMRSVDPERPIFDDVFNTFMGGALISFGPGALGGIERSDPAGLTKEDGRAMDATQDYVQASNRRYAFEVSISSPDYAENTSPAQRVADLKKLEKLQEKEAQQLLKNHKFMREYIAKKDAPEAKTELLMLDRLVARANATKTDIAVARSRRTTATQALAKYKQEQEERKDIQGQIDDQVLEIQDVQRMADNIDKVQNNEALESNEEYEALVKAGYGKWTEKHEFIILPKGQRALNHLVQQHESLVKKMEEGYTGTDRRTDEGRKLRAELDNLSDDELEQMLFRRDITGLQNRRAFRERAENDESAKSYAFADVDTLAWVNDNMGHNAGDRMLQAIGDAFLEVEGNGITAYHISGDEFVLTGPSDEAVETAMQKVRTTLRDNKINAGMDQVTPTLTWGKGNTAEAADAAMNRMAETRLQQGKRAGRKQKPVSHKDIASKQMTLLHSENADRIIDDLIEKDETYRAAQDSGVREAPYDNYGKKQIRLSAERKAEIIKLAKSGTPYAEIAKQFGIAETYVASIARAAGVNRGRGSNRITKKTRERIKKLLIEGGLTQEQIAKKAGVSRATISKINKEVGRPQRKRLLFQRKAGKAPVTRRQFIKGMLSAAIAANVPTSVLGTTKVKQAAIVEVAELFHKTFMRGSPRWWASPKTIEAMDAATVKPGGLYTAEAVRKAQRLMKIARLPNETDDSFWGRIVDARRILWADGKIVIAAEKAATAEAKKPRAVTQDAESRQLEQEVKDNLDQQINEPLDVYDEADTYEALEQQQYETRDMLPQMPTTWWEVRKDVERGDAVEIVTPTGALEGTVHSVQRHRGRDRMRVVIEGMMYTFNMETNSLMRQHGQLYEQHGADSQLNSDNVTIGEIAREGRTYADLAQDVERVNYFSEVEEVLGDRGLPTYLPRATKKNMKRAEAVKRMLARYKNLPDITLVASIEDLPDDVVEAIIEETGGDPNQIRQVRGYFAHRNPEQGVFVIVPHVADIMGMRYSNLSVTQQVERGVTETVFHEVVGHYGIRGLIGDEAKLRELMHSLVDSMSSSRRKALSRRLGLPLNDPSKTQVWKTLSFEDRRRVMQRYDERKQLAGEEYIAYIVGQQFAKNLDITPKERTIVEKIIAFIKEIFIARGWDRHFFGSPDRLAKKVSKGFDITDRDVSDLIERAHDYVRYGNKWKFNHLDGQTDALAGKDLLFMREGNIFQAGLITAINDATTTMLLYKVGEKEYYARSKNQLKQIMKAKPGGVLTSEELPLFTEKGTKGTTKDAITQAKKDGYFTGTELKYQRILPFIDNMTFGDLATYGTTSSNEMPWFDWGMPPVIESKYSAAKAVLQPTTVRSNLPADKAMTRQETISLIVYGIKDERMSDVEIQSWWPDGIGPSQDLKDASQSVLDDINNTLISNKVEIPKAVLLEYLNNDRAVQVRVARISKWEVSPVDIATQLLGRQVVESEYDYPNWPSLTPEELALVKAEVEVTRKKGPDIGQDETTGTWVSYPDNNVSHISYMPHASSMMPDTLSAFVITQAGNGPLYGRDTTHSDHLDNHYSSTSGRISLQPGEVGVLHVRFGIGYDLDANAPTAANPAMQGTMWYMGELQTDWFQRLSKSFPTQDAANAYQRNVRDKVDTLVSRGAIATGVYIERIKELVAGVIAEQPSEEELQGIAGAVNAELTNTGQTLIPNNEIMESDAGKRVALSRKIGSIRNNVLEKLKHALTKEITDHLPRISTDDIFPEDIRLHEKLDKVAVRLALLQLRKQLEEMDYELDTAQTRNTFAETENYWKSAMRRLVDWETNLWGASNVGDQSWQLRIAMVTPLLQKHIKSAFSEAGFGTGGVDQMSALVDKSVRKTAIISKDVFVPHSISNPEYFIQQAIEKSALSAGVPPTVKLRALADGDGNVEIVFTGLDSEINKAIPLVGDIISKYLETTFAPSWRSNEDTRISDVVSQGAGNARIGSSLINPDDIFSWANIKQENIELPDDQKSEAVRDKSAQFYIRNREEFIIGEIEMTMDMEEDTWAADNQELYASPKTADGRMLSRRLGEYSNLITGDGDNELAENWLKDQKKQFVDRVTAAAREPGGALYEQSKTNLGAKYDADPSALFAGEIPAEIDSDGNITKTGGIWIYKKKPGQRWRIYIGDSSVSHRPTWTEVKEVLPYAVSEYFTYYVGLNEFPHGESTLLKTGPNPFYDPAQLIDPADVPRNDEPDWDQMRADIEMGLTVDTQFETLEDSATVFKKKMELRKRSAEGYIPNDAALAGDRWRIAALKAMIADAVRKGVPRIAWSGGLASVTRGGQSSLAGQWLDVDEMTWTLEKMTIRGVETEVFVVKGKPTPNSDGTSRDNMWDKPLVIDASPERMTSMMGHDVRKIILEQAAGDQPRSPLDKQVAPKEDDLLVTSSLSATGRRIWFLQLAGTNNIIETADTEEEINVAKQAYWNNAQASGDWGGSSAVGLPSVSEFGGEFITSGRVRREQISNDPMRVLISNPNYWSQRSNQYSETLQQNILKSSRMNYEGLTYKAWNDFLKQYGVEITDGQMKTINLSDAQYTQGEQQASHTPADIIQQYGEPTIEAVAGQSTGFTLTGSSGLLLNQVFATRPEAEEARRQFIQTNSNQPANGINVFQIDITDEMRDIFSKPVAGFHYDPYEDPILKAAAEKIGSHQQKFMERYTEWRKAWKHEAHQGVFDKFYGIKYALKRAEVYGDLDAENNPWIQARLTTSLDSVMKAVLEYGHPVWKEGIVQTEGKGLIELLQPVINDIETWGMYMAGVRAKRLMEEGREKLFTAEEIDQMVALGEAFPHFKKVAADYAVFNKNMLDFAEEAGIINSETRPMWEHADHVPFFRVEDNRLAGPLSPSAGIANQNSPIKRLRGGEGNVGDIMHNIMMNVTNLVDGAMKNHAALMTVDALRESGIIGKKPRTLKQEMIPLDQVRKLLIARGMNPDTIPAEALSGFQKMFAVQPPSGEGVISVLRDGKKEYYYTDDPLLYRAMSSINMKQWGQWMNLFRAPKRLLTVMVTLDPGFMLANFVRDTASAFVLSRDHFIPVAGAIKGLGQALIKDEAMRTMLSAGAAFESGYINHGDPKATHKMLKRAMRKKGFVKSLLVSPRTLFEAYKALGSAVENSNRMAVYNAAIAAGKSKAQAVFEAKDLMDFSMSGDWPFIQFLIQTVPFMGARLQGIHRLGRGMNEHPVAFAVKGMMIMMAGLALWAAFRDDERYKELEEWDKDTYFHWWIGDQHFRLPKPFEVGALFNTVPERIMEYWYSNENDAGKLLLKRFGFMMGETFNINPLPQTLRPLMESYFNHNFFQDRSIVSPYEEQRMAPEEYRYSTSPTFVEMARSMPGSLDTASGKIRSPLHLQNLYAGYAGTLGRYIVMVSDAMIRWQKGYPDPPAWRKSDYPVLGRFMRGDAPRRTKYEQEVYNLIRKVTEIQGSMRFLDKTDQLDRMDKIEEDWESYIDIASDLEDIREDVQYINKDMMETWLDDDMDAEEKRERLDELQYDKNEYMREGWALRPGGEEAPAPVSSEDIQFMLNEFGVDDEITAQIETNAPETASLMRRIDTLGMRELQQLAKLGD